MPHPLSRPRRPIVDHQPRVGPDDAVALGDAADPGVEPRVVLERPDRRAGRVERVLVPGRFFGCRRQGLLSLRWLVGSAPGAAVSDDVHRFDFGTHRRKRRHQSGIGHLSAGYQALTATVYHAARETAAL